MARRLIPAATCLALTMVLPWSALVPAQAGKARSTGGVKRTAQSAFRDRQIFKGRVSAAVTQGEKQLLAGQYDSAADTFRQALSRNAKDVPALCGLGFALGLQFKLDGADQQFDKALKINGNEPLAHVGKAFVKLNRLQSSSMTIIMQRTGILSAAESECRKALKSDPSMPEGLVVLGMVQKEQGRLSDAIANYSKAIDTDPAFAAAYTRRGLAQLDSGNTAAAEQDLKKAISLRSNNAAAHYGLGKTYLAQGQVDAALKELNTALAQNRNSAPIHVTMGDAYRRQGNNVAAIAEYKKAVGIKAENTDAYLRLSDIYEDRGDLEFALADVRSGLELNPGSVELHRRAGDVSLRLEKTDDAIKEYTVTLDLSPGDTAAVKGMTRAYVIKAQKEATGAFFLSNNFESAEQMIQQAIKLNPGDMELRLADAKFRAMSGRPVDIAAVGTPTNDAERIAYAEALLAQHKYQEATQQMATVINNSTEAKQTLAVADMALMIRDLDSAEAAYKKAVTISGAEARGRRGLDAVAKARDEAQKDLRFASDLAMKKELGSAVDQYRKAAYLNPRLADAHYGLAEALKKLFPKNPSALREAAQHYRAYISLDTDLSEKEKNKIERMAEKCVEKAYKIERKTGRG